MYAEDFPIRLAKLRTDRGVSARDMSLSIGQNPGYINNIETGKALPSMTNFFYICEYLKISPEEFFDFEVAQPAKFATLVSDLKHLNQKQFDSIASIVSDLAHSK